MSATDWISGVVKELHHPKLAFAVFFACAVCLFLSGPVASLTGATWLAAARPWLLLGVLVCAGLLLWEIGSVARTRLRVKAGRQRAIKALGSLSREEQRQLALWIENDTRSGRMDIGNPVAEALVDQGIMERGERSEEYKGVRVYLIPPAIWNHLRSHPELLEPWK
jgi:hypothetical protein